MRAECWLVWKAIRHACKMESGCVECWRGGEGAGGELWL